MGGIGLALGGFPAFGAFGGLGDSAAMAGLDSGFGMWGAPAAEAAGGWGVNAATGGGMDWFEQLMQNYNPDLGFQGLNEAGSGALAGGLGTPTGFEDIPFGTTYPDYIDPKFTGGFSLPNLPGGTGNMLSQLLGNSGAIGAALGAGAGALGGGQKPAGSITTIQDVPDWLKPYVMANLQGGAGVLSQINPYNPLIPQAQAEASKTIGGQYLSPQSNPWLQDTYNQAAKAVTDTYLSTTQPRTDAMFYKGGAFGPGNSAYEETVARNQFGLGQNLKNLGTDIFGANYNQERGRQYGATMGAPSLVSGSSEAAFSPFKAYSSLFPNASSQTSPYFSNPMAGILGGGLAGYTLGNAFK